jgi:hypothetical protein
MKSNKRHTFLIIMLIGGFFSVYGQNVKEAQQELSKKASKGYLYRIENDPSGAISITYKIGGDKKKDEVFFEKYTFNKDLSFKGTEAVNISKENNPDIEVTQFYASVGGCTSFDVLSMKLKMHRRVVQRRWSDESQKYVYNKTISSETIKARNDNGKVYMGCASFMGNSDKSNEIFNIVRTEGEKKNPDTYFILMMNSNLDIREIPFDMSGPKTLVYAEQFANDDIAIVFAPGKGSADLSTYNYFVFGQDGTLKTKAEFKSPSTALLITSSFIKDESVFFCGTSVEGQEPFEKVFDEYAPIQNPCYTGGNNPRDQKWEKSTEGSMDNFHFLKFTGNKLEFSSTTPIKDFKSKFVTAASDKGADPYKGKKFYVSQFYVTAKGEFLVAGQLTGKVNIGDLQNPNFVRAYYDVICMHFDNTGNLRAQYGVKKINNDKKSEIFEMPLQFIPSADGSTVHFEILEVKGVKGYESFFDAYYGRPTFYATYFPRIITINTSSALISDSKILGGEKFFVRGSGRGTWNEQERTMTYVGHDDDFKKVWTAKLTLD